MTLRRTALAGLAGAAALAPAAPAHAVAPQIDPLLRMAAHAHESALDRHVELRRTSARLRGVQLDARLRAKLRDWSIAHLRQSNERLEKRNRRLRRAGGAPAVAVPAHLQAIAACESGGNPGAVDASGTYRGKYQFDLQTWASVGGSGDPAAAPEAEQDRRAAMLYQRVGASAWPVCGA